MKTFLLYLLLFASANAVAQTTIYDYTLKTALGSDIALARFKGKKILLVNTASASTQKAQVYQLDTLCRAYQDSSLIVIIFPSNDFAHEPKSDQELAGLYGAFSSNVFIAAKTSVTGQSAAPVYTWLNKKTHNGSLDLSITSDFQKILINRTGQIVGIYSARVAPLDASLVNAINNY